jgi:thioredoxin reductase
MKGMTSDCDVLIVGGGPAGSAAAMALARMGRSTLLCDDQRPRNAASEHINNFPFQDGVQPERWRRQTRESLEKYQTVHVYQGAVLAIEREGPQFRARLSSGESPRCRKVILAHGILDPLPSAPGFRELWGKAVFHCPYCHGFEVRQTRLGLIANGAAAEHLLPMVYALSTDAILFTNGQADLTSDFRRHLETRKVPLIEGQIKWLAHEDEQLQAVVLESGDVHLRDNLFLAPGVPYQSKSQFGDHLGCEKSDVGLYKVSPIGKTTVDGVFAAGDIVTGQHSVLGAAATGQLAGAGVVSELLKEDFTAT